MGRKPQRPKDIPKFSTADENHSQLAVENSVVANSEEGKETVRNGDNSTVSGGAIAGQTTRITTLLVREAARLEAMRFMPSVSQILMDQRVSIPIKLRLFELLLTFGVGSKPESGKVAVNVQNAVIALQPRRAAIDTLPIANPLPPGVSGSAGLLGPLRGIAGVEPVAGSQAGQAKP